MNVSKLRKAVDDVLPATAEKGFVEGWDTIVFNNGELVAYNDKICISTVLEESEGLSCAVNSDNLQKVLKGIKEPDINLLLSDGKLNITTMSSEITLATSKALSKIMPMIDNIAVDLEKFKYLPKDFIDGVKLCYFAVSDDFNNEKNLYCMYFKNNEVYGGSNFRLSRFTFDRDMEHSFLIPKSTIPSLIRFNPSAFQLTEGWCHFLNSDETIFSCRVVEGYYPNVSQIMNEFSPTYFIEMPDKLKELIDSITYVLNNVLEIDRITKIAIDSGTIVLQAEKESAVWIKHKINYPDISIKLKMQINSVFLSEILKLTNKLQIDGSKAKFETGHFEHLIMLCEDI